jgi:hypothetical protein
LNDLQRPEVYVRAPGPGTKLAAVRRRRAVNGAGRTLGRMGIQVTGHADRILAQALFTF